MTDEQMTAREKAVLIERARNMVRSGGPHEWGYRDLADGTFITDPFPFQAAQVLATMTPEPAQPAEAWLNDPASLESGDPAQPAESPEALGPLWRKVQKVHSDAMANDWSVADYRAGMIATLAATTARPTEREPDGWLAVKVNGEGGVVMPYGPLHPHPDRPNDPRYRWAPVRLGDPT